MSLQNPIVNYLQQQKDRIARMLAPGSKMPRGDQGSFGFSPVASDFGGRKFQLAAHKMRILKQENMGETRSERTMNMANTIQAKFQDAHRMLHISAAGRQENTSWSEVGMIFPNQASGHAETPVAADELRRGSVIQQFSTFPKPGQSIESFKAQTQSTPVMRKQDTSPPKKAVLSPRNKLFSSVQELTSGQKEKKNIKEADVVSPAEISAPASIENVQRKVEQVAQVEAPAVNAKSSLSIPNELAPQKIEKLAPLQLRESETKESSPVSSLSSKEYIQKKVEQAVMPALPALNTQAKLSASLPALQRSQTQELPKISKPEIPLARPVQGQKTDIPKLALALPAIKKSGNIKKRAVASPTMPIAQFKINPVPVQSISRSGSIPPSAPVVQRQLEIGDPQQAQEAQTSGSVLEGTPEVLANVSDKKVSDKQEYVPAESRMAEMPLKKHLEQKQSSVRGLHIETNHAHPVVAREILKLKNSPVQRRLSEPKKKISFDATLPVKQQAVPRTESNSLSLHYPVTVFPSVAREIAAVTGQTPQMTLAKVTPLRDLSIQRSASPAPEAHLTTSMPVENNAVFQQAPAPRPVGTQNVIQRVLEEHAEPQNQNHQPHAAPQPVNINGLAEKIFPLVKRLLEIESERTGSRFR